MHKTTDGRLSRARYDNTRLNEGLVAEKDEDSPPFHVFVLAATQLASFNDMLQY